MKGYIYGGCTSTTSGSTIDNYTQVSKTIDIINSYSESSETGENDNTQVPKTIDIINSYCDSDSDSETSDNTSDTASEFDFEKNKRGNYTDIQQFASKVLCDSDKKKNEYRTFLMNKMNCNALIYAPTQVGKTNATKDFMEVCMEQNVPLIVSCDNKTDQLEQFYSRIKEELSDRNFILLKAGSGKFDDQLTKSLKTSRKIIIFCLNNGSQIKKIRLELLIQIPYIFYYLILN